MFLENDFKLILDKLDQITWKELTIETKLHLGLKYWVCHSNSVTLCTLSEYKKGQFYWSYPASDYRDNPYSFSYFDITHYMPYFEPREPAYYEAGNY